VTRSLGLAPTTQEGKTHDSIERSLDNRESLQIGKGFFQQQQLPGVPNLNDLSAHRNWTQRKNQLNVITGGYMSRRI